MTTADPFIQADLGPYLHVADGDLQLLSVFDDLTYDRADADMLSPGMRMFLARTLKPLGFQQKSGNVFAERASGIRCLLPKSHALGASPFDILRYTDRKPGDYFVLTPTQVACQFIEHYDHEEAVARTKGLIRKHPINILKLMDYLERKPEHEIFQNAIGHLRFVQREAVESKDLRRLRPLGFSA
ncbi:MAG: hypothetical protein HRU11_06820 [Parvularculaceae bacterium]|nr:hypothetical protein [Parvularculaceae bacterium]